VKNKHQVLNYVSPVLTVPSPLLFAPPPKEYTEESLNSISHSASTTSTLLQCIPLLDYFCYYQGHKLRAAFCLFLEKLSDLIDGTYLACQKRMKSILVRKVAMAEFVV
jgi:hypothetical protein